MLSAVASILSAVVSIVEAVGAIVIGAVIVLEGIETVKNIVGKMGGKR